MKANEAPEKLYIALNELTEDGRTFVLDHRVDYPICTEYARTDAFIEKATAWLSNVSLEDMTYKYNDFDTSEGWYKFIEDFRKYMSL